VWSVCRLIIIIQVLSFYLYFRGLKVINIIITSAYRPRRCSCVVHGRGERDDATTLHGTYGCQTWREPGPTSGSSWPSGRVEVVSWTTLSDYEYPRPLCKPPEKRQPLY